MRYKVVNTCLTVYKLLILHIEISNMKKYSQQMKPQDIVLLLKIISNNNPIWQQLPMADELELSQSEVSESVARSKKAGLLDSKGKDVMRYALMEFLEHGISYVFPQSPGSVVRGIPTAHSTSPLRSLIESNEVYVWPYGKGTVRGHAIEPLYPSVPKAVQKDELLHELLALVDAVRIGRAREKEIAVGELKNRLNIGK